MTEFQFGTQQILLTLRTDAVQGTGDGDQIGEQRLRIQHQLATARFLKSIEPSVSDRQQHFGSAFVGLRSTLAALGALSMAGGVSSAEGRKDLA